MTTPWQLITTVAGWLPESVGLFLLLVIFWRTRVPSQSALSAKKEHTPPQREASGDCTEAKQNPIKWSPRQLSSGNLGVAIANETTKAVEVEVWANDFRLWSPRRRDFLTPSDAHPTLALRAKSYLDPTENSFGDDFPVAFTTSLGLLKFGGNHSHSVPVNEDGIYRVHLIFKVDGQDFEDDLFVSWSKGSKPREASDPRKLAG